MKGFCLPLQTEAQRSRDAPLNQFGNSPVKTAMGGFSLSARSKREETVSFTSPSCFRFSNKSEEVSCEMALFFWRVLRTCLTSRPKWFITAKSSSTRFRLTVSN